MKEEIKYSTEIEEKLMYMNDEELFCFFEKYKLVYEEELLTVVLRGKENEKNL